MKECCRCHEVKPISEFTKNKRTSDGLECYCKACNSERNRRYRQENPDKISESKRRYREQNPEKVRAMYRSWISRNPDKKRAYNRDYREQHPETVLDTRRRHREQNRDAVLEYQRDWTAQNPERVKEYTRRKTEHRHEREYLAKGGFSDDIRTVLFDIQHGRCLYCDSDLSVDYHLDHIIPLVFIDLFNKYHPGHTPSNLALACKHCSLSKGESELEDWLAWKYPSQMDTVLRRVQRHIEAVTFMLQERMPNE